ncbi:MAG: hemolysin, partial [Gammaproteobacteria bacterium]|nr:hemolysin [Gammaproteobacteria bacterium]
MTDPFDLNLKSPLLTSLINRTLGLDVMSKMYDARPPGLDTKAFLQYALDVVGVTLQVNNQDNLDKIPRKGPLL